MSEMDRGIGGEEWPILPNLNCGLHHEVVRSKEFKEEAYAYQDRSIGQDPLSAPGERRNRLYEPWHRLMVVMG